MTSCVHDHGDWASPWGPTDRIGAGNFLTRERRLAALASVETGELLDLGHVIENDAPRIPPNQTPFVMTLSARADNVVKRRARLGATNEIGTTLERIEMTTHVGTHIDALGHVTVGDRMYNGLSASNVLDDFGLTELGVENIPPMITRGVWTVAICSRLGDTSPETTWHARPMKRTLRLEKATWFASTLVGARSSCGITEDMSAANLASE